MQKLNRVQRHLLSFGYPTNIIKAYKSNSQHYRKEVRNYVSNSLVERRRQLSGCSKE